MNSSGFKPKSDKEKVDDWVKSALESVAKTREEALSFLVFKLIDGDKMDDICRQAGISIERRRSF